MTYRTIYKNRVGPIPKDEDGRSYEIHHIDGNRNNNDVSNLKCVSIQEHYDIHYSQGDWNACVRIAEKMQYDPRVISQLRTLDNQARIANGTHNFLGVRNPVHKLIALGNHPFQGGDETRKGNEKRFRNGTHNFLIKVTCPYCGKIGQKNNMLRYHFDKCKSII